LQTKGRFPAISAKTSGSGSSLTWVAGLIAGGLLLSLIATSPNHLVYDESYHIGLAEKILHQGLGQALVDPRNQSAAGPLFTAFHLVFAPITYLAAPATRWINFLLLLVVVALTALTRTRIMNNREPIGSGAIALLGVPFLWPATGMALTEIPALVFFCGFVLCIQHLCSPSQEKSSTREAVAWAILAGICLGLAILGRQTYLITLPAFLVLFFLGPVKPRLLALSLLSTGVVSGWLFFIWGGLVPPSQAKVNSGLQPEHLLYSVAYVASATAFISPRWLCPKDWRSALIAAVIGAIVAVGIRDHGDPPAKSLLLKLFGGEAAYACGVVIFALMGALGALWILNTCRVLWSRRDDPFQMFAGVLLLGLVIAPVKVSHLFSSRYVVGLLGVLILVLPPQRSSLLAARILIGSALGAAILWSYYGM
jgi:hypothetical protein